MAEVENLSCGSAVVATTPNGGKTLRIIVDDFFRPSRVGEPAQYCLTWGLAHSDELDADGVMVERFWSAGGGGG